MIILTTMMTKTMVKEPEMTKMAKETKLMRQT